MPNTEEAVEGIAMSITALIAQMIKQGPWAIIAGILCWGIFVTVPQMVTQFGLEQDALRTVFAQQMQAQREWFDKREDAERAQRMQEFRELIQEQKATTQALNKVESALQSNTEAVRSNGDILKKLDVRP